MSSRALRRLQKQQLENAIEDPDALNDDIIDYAPQKTARNLFDLLNDADQGEDEEEEENEEIADENDTAHTATELQAEPTPSSPRVKVDTSKPKEKGKGKKKKKGKKAKTKKQNETKDISEISLQELEETLNDINSSVPANSDKEHVPKSEGFSDEQRQLLSVNYRYLDADAEMKRMFGSRVVNSEARTAASGRVFKRTKLVTPKIDWPRYTDTGLKMEIAETVDGITWFKFVHGDSYKESQQHFAAAVARHDHEGLMRVNLQYPFHVSNLLQISEVAKHGGDWATAGECIERALYSCERGFHVHFTWSTGTSRLSYRQAENRPFFVAIVRHTQFLARRGCWRTAFEYNKLLFSLEPDSDPLGALLSMDYFAMSARDYRYLVNFASNWKTKGDIYPKDLRDLPNFAFVSAYAQFKLSDNDDEKKVTSPSSVMLQEAIVKFPAVVSRLFGKIGAPVPGDQLFVDLPTDPYLDLLQTLFVERSWEFFKEPEVLAWLKSNAEHVTKHRQSEISSAPKQVNCVENSEVPLNVCRHVVLTEIQSLLSHLPSSVTSRSYHMFDPLPPADSEAAYDMEFGASNDGILDYIQALVAQNRHNLPAQIMEEMRNWAAILREGNRPDQLPGTFPGLEDFEDLDDLDETQDHAER